MLQAGKVLLPVEGYRPMRRKELQVQDTGLVSVDAIYGAGFRRFEQMVV
jgi:hypothetical protein